MKFKSEWSAELGDIIILLAIFAAFALGSAAIGNDGVAVQPETVTWETSQ